MAGVVGSLSTASNDFGLNLYKSVVTSPKSPQNVFISPFCLHSILSMTYVGAAGNTKQQFESALKLDGLKEGTQEAYQQFINKVPLKYFNIANRLYLQSKGTVLEDFKQSCKTNFNAEAVTLRFEDDAEAGRTTINQWVEGETKGKIQELIPQGSLSSDTALVLVNAIYFKGDWDVKFDRATTIKDSFHLNENESLEVNFMRKEAKFNFGYSASLNCQILEIPYQNKDLSMLIVLPLVMDGLKDLEAKLDSAALSKLQTEMSVDEVEIRIPRFSIESSMTLIDSLTSMGIEEAFIAGKADLSKIDGTRNLFVSDVFHKTFIVVNEEGSEAAAAGAVGISTKMLPPSFTADHPFLFYIKDNSTDMILFLGRLVQPGLV
ncbi:leukocyte elastase inhibitor [Patella vulgata]|uniref:leukocyte elastase inhibitor n=1 Tax=Patella vulgata TaxID=6465 RepID=UPI00217F2705|nr:leukocyte elastase inhibitor [Patella vulgata]